MTSRRPPISQSRVSYLIITSVVTLVALGSQATATPMGDAVDVRAMKPATAQGARKVVAYYADVLNRAPFSVQSNARARCARYLSTARSSLAHAPETSCSDRVALELATASCALHTGSEDEVRSSFDRLIATRCEGALGGLEVAVRLSERWFRADLVRASTKALDPAVTAAKRLQERVGVIMTHTRGLRRALNGSQFGSFGGLYVSSVGKGSPAAQAGIRKGDVIASMAAQPTRTPTALADRLKRKPPRRTSVLIYRDGKRRQVAWPGRSLGEISLISLPERLPKVLDPAGETPKR